MDTALPPAISRPAARHDKAIVQACAALAGDEPPSLAQLAAQSGLSPAHFQRVFKAAMGLTPKQYASAHRSQRTRELMLTSPSVTQAMHDAGFTSSGRFYEQAPGILGMTPTHYRAGARHERLHVAIGACALGAIAVAASAKGIAAIMLGDEPEPLLRTLQDRFVHATMVAGDADYERLVAQVIGLVQDPALKLDLPLDLRGTAFQLRVWHALRSIPPGTTITYAQLAERIGAPTATRAVANACGANPLALVVPCHRVVRTDGSLGGYAWGIDRKRALLRHEASLASPPRSPVHSETP